MSMVRRHSHQVPALNTASLPDLVFTVLFFFMLVTHMQRQVVRVRYRTPQGTQLTKLVKKTAVIYIYIGRPVGKSKWNAPFQVQINDKVVQPDEIADYVEAERNRLSPEDQQQLTVVIRADRDVPMGLITDVKQGLRMAKALSISYSANPLPQPQTSNRPNQP